MVGHQGNAYGSICGMFFDPREQTGFVFLTNGASSAANEAGVYLVNRDIAQAVYTAFFGYEAPVVEVSASSASSAPPVQDAGASSASQVPSE